MSGVEGPAVADIDVEPDVRRDAELDLESRLTLFRFGFTALVLERDLSLLPVLSTGRYDSSSGSSSSELLLEPDIEADESRRLRFGIRPDLVVIGRTGLGEVRDRLVLLAFSISTSGSAVSRDGPAVGGGVAGPLGVGLEGDFR